MKTQLIVMQSILLAGMLAGCATGGNERGSRDSRIGYVEVSEDELAQFTANRPAEFHPFYEVLLRQGERNAVLNYQRLGLELLKHGYYRHAAEAFDEAIARIETIYADNKQARKARSKFTPEYVKDYKGDPYERAMAFFYRGLIFLEHDDYQNARAAMLAGLEQDAMAEQETYAKDFALLYYLAGWASACDGDRALARDLFDQARQLNLSLEPPAESDRMLYLGFLNQGPVKKRKGEHDEQLYYERSWPAERDPLTRPYGIELRVDGRPQPLTLAEDIYFQAATRGGRAVDVINAGKAEFKETTEATGQVLAGAGMATMTAAQSNPYNTNRQMAGVGAGLALLGAVSSIVSSRTEPEADIRYWDNLPELVYLGTGSKPDDRTGGPANLVVTVTDANDTLFPELIDAKPRTFPNRIDPDGSCDWIGFEPIPGPVPVEHVNP